MAFTAGSPELAKAQKLGSQLAHLFVVFGTTGISGATGALMIEQYAEKLGFGITGITTGGGFPPFGSFTPDLNSGVAAVLQNPRGETMANGVTLGIISGRTVGIYMHKFVRSGEDFVATPYTGLTLSAATTQTGTTLHVYGPFVAFRNDLFVIGNNQYRLTTANTSGGSAASAGAGVTAEVTVTPVIGAAYAVGTALNIQSIGVTRGTSGVAGRTFENFVGNGGNFGYTATVYFGTDGLTYWVN